MPAPAVAAAGERRLLWAGAALFVCLTALGIARHEMWRDELEAWLIARDSGSLPELLATLRYAGHPALWHVCLFAVSRLVRDPIAMQVLQLASAIGAAAVFLAFAPFPVLIRLLFVLGYFPLYEYGVISRDYALSLLLALAFCALFPRRARGSLPLALVLALLANTNPYGLILSAALAFTLLYDEVSSGRWRVGAVRRRADLAASLLLYAAGALGALRQILPPPDSGFAVEWRLDLRGEWLLRTLEAVWNGYVPLPNVLRTSFWNTNVVPPIARAPLGLGLLVVSAAMLARRRAALVLYLAGTGALLLFTYVKFFGTTRHHGYLFLVLVAAIWIARFGGDSQPPVRLLRGLHRRLARHRQAFLTGLLAVHAAGGMLALAMDVALPFSASRQVAGFLARQEPRDATIIGSRDPVAQSLTAYLDRAIYYPESDRFGTFVVWSHQRHEVGCPELVEQVRRIVRRENRPALLVLSYDRRDCRHGLDLVELGRFTRSIVADERYYVYRVLP